MSIEIDVSSRTALDIGVEYDALAVPKTRREMYVMRTSQSRAGSTEWQVATIHIFDGAFANSQRTNISQRSGKRKNNSDCYSSYQSKSGICRYS